MSEEQIELRMLRATPCCSKLEGRGRAGKGEGGSGGGGGGGGGLMTMEQAEHRPNERKFRQEKGEKKKSLLNWNRKTKKGGMTAKGKKGTL